LDHSDNLSRLVKDVITPAEISESDLPAADISNQNDWNFVQKRNNPKVLPGADEENESVFQFRPKKLI